MLSREDRIHIAQSWREVGIAEHASIAAFARFVLHLLSLGAPPDLIDRAISAMRDEVNHAKMCFGVAKKFDDMSVGPGGIDISEVITSRDSSDRILLAAIHEGCICETISAEYARAACGKVSDPMIREVLEKISADELRHADLSWDFLTWLLDIQPHLRPTAAATFSRILRSLGATNSEEPTLAEERNFEEYGLDTQATRQVVAQQTVHKVIIPRLSHMFGDAFPENGCVI